MAWQLIFKAPEPDSDESTRQEDERPLARKPVSMTVQLDPGTRVVVAAGDDEDDD